MHCILVNRNLDEKRQICTKNQREFVRRLTGNENELVRIVCLTSASKTEKYLSFPQVCLRVYKAQHPWRLSLASDVIRLPATDVTVETYSFVWLDASVHSASNLEA